MVGPRLVTSGAELNSIEAPCGKIVRVDPELINAFREMMGEALIRRQLKKQKELAHAVVDGTLNVDWRCEHAVRDVDVKLGLHLASERMAAANVIDDVERNTCGSVGADAQ